MPPCPVALGVFVDHSLGAGELLMHVAPLRQVCRHLAEKIDTRKAIQRHRRCCPCVSVHFCRGCLEVSRRPHHFGFCPVCKPARQPEVSVTTMREVYGIPRSIYKRLSYRFSHRGMRKLVTIAALRSTAIQFVENGWGVHKRRRSRKQRGSAWTDLVHCDKLAKAWSE
jgi:hypothetical protein